MINTKKIMKKAVEASTGLTVAIAFLNVALLVAKIVETVTSDESVLASADTAELEEND